MLDANKIEDANMGTDRVGYENNKQGNVHFCLCYGQLTINIPLKAHIKTRFSFRPNVLATHCLLQMDRPDFLKEKRSLNLL